MNKREDVELILEEYFPHINKYLGYLIKKEMEMPDFLNGILTSRLLKAARKLPSLELEKEKKYLEDEDYYEDYDDDDEVYYSGSYKLDSGLYYLEHTLYYGDQNCKGFSCIFKNSDVKKYQEIENLIAEILVQVKAYEFLSKAGFKNIARIDRWKNELIIDFLSYKPRNYYELMATQLYSGKYIDEHPYEYGENAKIRSLTNDISYAVNQKYPQIAGYCRNHVGPHVGILFLSTSRDYFGDKNLKNSVYGLDVTKLNAILNNEFVKREQEGEKYKYLNHIVVTTGRNIRKAIIYPNMKI
ncbi:MAG: hypothetical protein JW845_00825 [Dehalococcoidales bacterium]|nr:hypothetical protein [Dehalococcoidales bacterium]